MRGKRVRRTLLNDGDVIQIGQHEIMYFDERMARTRAGQEEDDALPLPHEDTNSNHTRLEESTHAEDNIQPIDARS